MYVYSEKSVAIIVVEGQYIQQETDYLSFPNLNIIRDLIMPPGS